MHWVYKQCTSSAMVCALFCVVLLGRALLLRIYKPPCNHHHHHHQIGVLQQHGGLHCHTQRGCCPSLCSLWGILVCVLPVIVLVLYAHIMQMCVHACGTNIGGGAAAGGMAQRARWWYMLFFCQEVCVLWGRKYIHQNSNGMLYHK